MLIRGAAPAARRPHSATVTLPVWVPASVPVLRGGAAARGCQARRHDVEDNVISGCQAPPVDAPSNPPRRVEASGGGCKLGTANPKSEIRNPKFRRGGWAAFLIPNSIRVSLPLPDSATPTGASRQRIQAAGRQIRNSKFEIPAPVYNPPSGGGSDGRISADLGFGQNGS
jgi:hypothetical protein